MNIKNENHQYKQNFKREQAGTKEFTNQQAESSLRHPKSQQFATHIFPDPLPGYHGRRSCQIGTEGLTSFINCFLKHSHQLHLHHACYWTPKNMSPNTKARIDTINAYRSSWYLDHLQLNPLQTATPHCTADLSGLRAVEGEEELRKGPAAQRPAHLRRARGTMARRLVVKMTNLQRTPRENGMSWFIGLKSWSLWCCGRWNASFRLCLGLEWSRSKQKLVTYLGAQHLLKPPYHFQSHLKLLATHQAPLPVPLPTLLAAAQQLTASHASEAAMPPMM